MTHSGSRPQRAPILRSRTCAKYTGPSRFVALVLLWAALLPGAVTAQTDQTNGDARPELVAVRLDEGEVVELNGLVDEAFWQRATPASGFLQTEPEEGADPTELTEVYIAYDEDNLYIGAVLFDSDPGGILAYQKERDAPLFTDDRFVWILDTFNDGRTGYFFEINPAGLMGDGILGGGGGGGGPGGGGPGGGFGGFGVNKSWDGIWEARVSRNGDGWSAEIRIPFRTLNFNPSVDAWGINFERTVRRKNEESRWSGHRRNQQITRPVHAGRLRGLEGLSQGVGLEIVPYSLAGWSETPGAEDPTKTPVDAGFDLSYNVTPSLRAAVTVNTDFAEVEVDQRRVNLTRFPLFFPERRDFFLEGSGVFSFAPQNGVTPYFSRNIGLAEGEPVPITYGARLGGQTGRYELGFVHVRTGSNTVVDTEENDTTLIQPENFTVARIKRTFLEQSTIGVMYTRRAGGMDSLGVAPPGRHTFGADLDFFTSRFLGDKNFQFEAFFVGHTKNEPGSSATFGDLTARGVRVAYPNDIWSFHTSYRELGNDFEPALGFTRRSGFRRVQPRISFSPRPRNLLGLRQLEWEFQFEYLTNMEWQRETQQTELKILGLRFHSGDRFDVDLQHVRERLDEEFEIREGLIVPVGDYETREIRAALRTAGQRMVSGSIEFTRGEFWSGNRTTYELSAAVKPIPGISISARYERNNVSLSQGGFNTNLVRFEGNWHPSPWASFTSNLQYDDVSDVVGLFARFRWILRPGSDLYLVYTQNWQRETDLLGQSRLTTLSRGATTKINYTYRF